MRYREIFKKWYFWILVIIWAIGGIYDLSLTYEKIFFFEYITTFSAAFLFWTILFFIGLSCYKLFKKVTKH